MECRKFLLVLWTFLSMLHGRLNAIEVSFTLFDAQDGLPAAQITALAQDHSGHLWVGTEVGLAMYDGYAFSTFYRDPTYIPARVNDLAVDHHGKLWIATTSGLFIFDQNRFQVCDVSGLDTLSIQNLFVEDNGKIFVASLHQLFVLESTSESIHQVDQQEVDGILHLAQGKDHTIWISNSTQLLLYQQGQLQDLSPQLNEIEPGIVGVLDMDHKALIGTSDENIYQMSRPDIHIELLQAYNNFFHDFRAFANWHERIWAIYGWGIMSLSPTRQILAFPSQWNIKYVNCSYVDLEGNLWVGSTEGLILVRRSLLAQWTDPVLNSEIYSLYLDSDGSLWLGGNRGEIYQSDSTGEIRPWSGPKSFGGEIMDIVEDQQDGNIWFASYWQGLVRKSGNDYRHFSSEIISDLGPDLLDVHIDAHRNLWLGTTRGLFSADLHSSTLKFKSYQASAISDQCDVYAIRGDGNPLWLASSCGLFRCDHGEIQRVILPDLPSQAQFKSVYVDDQHLWLGTIGFGLRKYHLQGEHLSLQAMIDEFSPSILDIVGNESTIWAGTPSGLIRVNRLAPDIDYQVITARDGFFKEGFAYLKLFLDQKEQLYVTTSRGLLKLTGELERKIPKREIILDRWSVDGRASAIGRDITLLPSSTKTIHIDYYYPELVAAQHINYRWRMTDDEPWTMWSKGRSLDLLNPKPGHYQLNIQAKKTHEIISDKRILFTIQPPWYQKRGLQFGILCLLGLLIYLFFQRREKQFKIKQELESQRALAMASLESRALRSQMNPHFLFNILNNLQEMILVGDAEIAQKYLNKFSRLMRMILNISTRDYIVIEQEIEFLKLYLDLEDLRFDHQFSYELNIDPDLVTAEIPVFMIQPLVENAIRHGLRPAEGERKLAISIQPVNNYIDVRIRDNGIGLGSFPEQSGLKKHHNDVRALDLLQQRLDIISQKTGLHCLVSIRNNMGPGTEAQLLLPLHLIPVPAT